jgi:hypothetical protein
MQEVIKCFVETQDVIHSLIVHNELDKAKDLYHDLLQLYDQISESDLEYFHKELAHEQVTSIHGDLTAAEKTVRIPIHVIIAAALVAVLSALVFINPSIVGLITFEDEVTQKVNFTFTESKIANVNLKSAPLSLAVTGNFTGEVKLFYKVGDDLTLIFDSSNSEEITFAKVCEDTCSIKTDSNAIELFAQIGDDSVLNLKEIVYTVPRDDNEAPIWTSKSKVFTITGQHEINLDDHFEDPDGDDLVFLSTSDYGLKVTVSNNIVKIVPESEGEMQITVIASDLDKLTKVPLTIISK